MWLQEAIRRGICKLHELEEDQVRLRNKSELLDAEINKLETKIMQACCVEELRMTRQYMGIHTTTLKDGRREFVALLHGYYCILPDKVTKGTHHIRKNAWY